MATVNIDFTLFRQGLQEIVELVKNNELTLRPVAVELVGIMHERIHDEGKASDGSRIGEYKSSYLKIREKYKHRGDTKVILVLTRKLSNSWGAFATEKGYAVGFTDDGAATGVTSLKKIGYAEENFNKKIGELTEDETEYVNTRVQEIVTDLLSDYGRR